MMAPGGKSAVLHVGAGSHLDCIIHINDRAAGGRNGLVSVSVSFDAFGPMLRGLATFVGI